MTDSDMQDSPDAARRNVLAGLLAFATFAPLGNAAWAQAAAASFMTPGQTDFLAALVDTLIPATETPGARAANVHLGLAGLIGRWASPQTRADVLTAIAAIEGDLKGRTGGHFVTASPADRLAALAALDATAFARPRPAAWKDYRTLKALAIRLYYSSEIGATQELRYDPLPGGYVGNLPFKAGDRAWAL